MVELKVIQVGNSLGLILPKELLGRLNLVKGDAVFATEAPGGVMLSPYDERIARQLALGRAVMGEYRETLRDLAT